MTEQDDDSVTTNPKARLKYLSSILSIVYICTYLLLSLLVATGHAQWPGGNGEAMLFTGFMMFVTYVVGVEVYEMVSAK